MPSTLAFLYNSTKSIILHLVILRQNRMPLHREGRKERRRALWSSGGDKINHVRTEEIQ